MTAKRFAEWENFSHLEPFGELRDDYRAARVASTIANANRGNDTTAFTDEDFLLKFKEYDVDDSVEEVYVKQTPDKTPEQLHTMMMRMFGVQAADLPAPLEAA